MTSGNKPSLTKKINELLDKNIDFTRLLKDKEITIKEEAEKAVKLAIRNLSNRKKHPVDDDALESFRNNWQAFLKSKTSEIYFKQEDLDQEYILEDLQEKLYKSGVKRKYVNNLHTSNMTTDDDDEENEPTSSQESSNTNSSADYKPRNTTRTLTLPKVKNMVDSDNEDIPENEKWFVNDFDMSTYLFRYRNESLLFNITKKHKEQLPSRLMAQSSIYYFTKVSAQSCIRDLPLNLIMAAYNDLNIINDRRQVPATVSSDIDDVIMALKSKDERVLMKVQGNIMIKNSNEESSPSNLIHYTNVLIDISKSLSKQLYHVQNNQHEGSFGEDTFVHDIVAPFFNNVFYGQLLKHKWANVKLATSTSTRGNLNYFPDYTLYAFVRDIRCDLLAVEVKQPNSGNGFIDEKKLPNEMRSMLDKLIEHKLESPVVCGIKIDGFEAITYKMDLCYNGVYRLVELDNFTFPTCTDELYKIRQIVPALFEILDIVNNVANNIEKKLKSRHCNLFNIDKEKVPKKHWRRGEVEYLSIKKTHSPRPSKKSKKNQN